MWSFWACFERLVAVADEWHVDQNLWGASTHAPRIISITVQVSTQAARVACDTRYEEEISERLLVCTAYASG